MFQDQMKDIGYYKFLRKGDTSYGSKARKQRRLLLDVGNGEAII